MRHIQQTGPSWKPLWAICAFGFAALVAGSAVASAPFNALVVFGTSLSDPGNAFALVGRSGTPPDYGLDEWLVPTLPYARGGHHLSNGATWIEQLARPLGLARYAGPAFRADGSPAANYAVGAARATVSGLSIDLPLQVAAFLQDTGGVAPADALYVVEMGGNDIRDALVVGGGGGNPLLVLDAALTSLTNQMTVLYGAGARTFLVWKVPDVGLTPAVRALDAIAPGTRAAASALTVTFNQQLEFRLSQLELALPGLEVIRFDVFTALHALVAQPAAYGLRVVDAACVTPSVPPFACRNAHEYLFWDGIHPTMAGHALIAEAAAAALAQHYE